MFTEIAAGVDVVQAMVVKSYPKLVESENILARMGDLLRRRVGQEARTSAGDGRIKTERRYIIQLQYCTCTVHSHTTCRSRTHSASYQRPSLRCPQVERNRNEKDVATYENR